MIAVLYSKSACRTRAVPWLYLTPRLEQHKKRPKRRRIAPGATMDPNKHQNVMHGGEGLSL